MSPMLPLVNFCQDYFQRVECEASVQLLRLKNAQVLHGRVENSEEEVNNVSLETVKWLHFMTDAIMSAHSAGAPGEPAASPTQPILTPATVARSPGISNAFPSLGIANSTEVDAVQRAPSYSA